MGRNAKLKRQRKADRAAAELNQPPTSAETASADDRVDRSTEPQAVPLTRQFLDRMERQGYGLKADNRAPEIPDDEQPQPQRR